METPKHLEHVLGSVLWINADSAALAKSIVSYDTDLSGIGALLFLKETIYAVPESAIREVKESGRSAWDCQPPSAEERESLEEDFGGLRANGLVKGGETIFVFSWKTSEQIQRALKADVFEWGRDIYANSVGYFGRLSKSEPGGVWWLIQSLPIGAQIAIRKNGEFRIIPKEAHDENHN